MYCVRIISVHKQLYLYHPLILNRNKLASVGGFKKAKTDDVNLKLDNNDVNTKKEEDWTEFQVQYYEEKEAERRREEGRAVRSVGLFVI